MTAQPRLRPTRLPGGKVGSGSGSGPGPGGGRTPHETRRAAPQGNRTLLRLATGFAHSIARPAHSGGTRLPHFNPREDSSTASQRIGRAVSRLKLRMEEFHAYRAWQSTKGMAPQPARHLPPTWTMPVRHTDLASDWIEPLPAQSTEIFRRTRGDSPHTWRTTSSTTAERCHCIDDSRLSRLADAQAKTTSLRIPRTTGSGASSSQYVPRLSSARRASASTRGPRFSRKRRLVGPAISFQRRAGPNLGLPSSPHPWRRYR